MNAFPGFILLRLLGLKLVSRWCTNQFLSSTVKEENGELIVSPEVVVVVE